MNTYLNYIIEANVGLLLLLAFYKLLLRRETSFNRVRLVLLTGIGVALLFPLFHFENNDTPSALAISRVVPSYWLPEVVIGGSVVTETQQTTSFNFWKYTSVVYGAGLSLFLVLVVAQLTQLLTIIMRSKTYKLHKLRIAESSEDKPVFSFFNFIFIGKAHELSPQEKEQIIRHESVHARQLHSFDILLINFLKIFFWFNPFINTYKKIFIQLHEFEADARAVENADVNNYCNLLARVALKSADFTMANHFNNSLTVKRIEMMRTIKNKIHPWKMSVIALLIPTAFFLFACHDQVMTDLSQSTLTQTDHYPAIVKADMDTYLKKNPEAKLSYIEGREEEVNKITSSEEAARFVVETYDLSSEGVDKKGVLMSNISAYAEALQTDKKIFTVVEKAPSFKGGYPAFMQHLRDNMRYPERARAAGKKGTVYIEFVVNENGAVSDTKVLEGVEPELDAEALRVVNTLPAWEPATQNGVAVKLRYVLPITFNPNSEQTEPLKYSAYKMDVKVEKTELSGKTIIEGIVFSRETGKPLGGTNIVIEGTSNGTTADTDGRFKLEIPAENGQVVFSFIGYDFEKFKF